jgi:hypothetical protein
VLDALVAAGVVRRRPAGWYGRDAIWPEVDLGGSGSAPVYGTESATSRLLDTVAPASTCFLVVYDGHRGGAGFTERAELVRAAVAERHPRRHRRLRLRDRLPVVRAVTEVQQRQPAARQARRRHGPRHRAGPSRSSNLTV